VRLYHAEPHIDINIASFMNSGGFHLINKSRLVNVYNLCYVRSI
jgi:hypothetical protein